MKFVLLTLFLLLALAVANETPSLESRIKGAYFGAIISDSLSLATHYEYDAVKIKKFYGEIDRFYAPGENTGGKTHGIGWGSRNYHGGNGRGPAKKAGEQTDYGDYNILVLEHLANTAAEPHRFDLKEFIPTWQKRMRTWNAWMCTQTRQTLQQVQQGVSYDRLGGRSNAMAIRYAAAFGYYDKLDDIVHAARLSTFTHRERSAHEGGEFFARVTYRVLYENETPLEAIKLVANAFPSQFIKEKVKIALDKVEEATDPQRSLSKEEFVDDLALTSMDRLWDVGKTEPIKVGKASPTSGTLPGSIYFIVKYMSDLEGAITANAGVGGDNASRAIAIGMVLGAYHGLEAVPAKLGEGKLVNWQHSMGLLDTLPVIKSLSTDSGYQASRDEL